MSKKMGTPAWTLILWSAAFAGALGSGLYIHARSVRAFENVLGQSQNISRKAEAAQAMSTELERYRRLSSKFRQVGMEKESEAKDHLENQADAFSKRLASLDPTAEDRVRDEGARRKLKEFMSKSTKLQPMLFTRDVFQKEEMRDLYESIGVEWEAIAISAREASAALQSSMHPKFAQSLLLIAAGAGLACLLVLGLLLVQYLRLRPLQIIGKRATEWTEWAQADGNSAVPSALRRKLPPSCAEVETALGKLSTTVRSQRCERLDFITAIATDLRAPLNRLHAALDVLAKGEATDPSLREISLSTARSSIFRLVKTLEDLSDLIDLPSTHLKLHEKIVDIRPLLSGIAETMKGPLSHHEITVSAPALPVWTHIDPDRFERVLIHLFSKMMNLLPQGGAIEAQLQTRPESGYRGIELLLSERRASGGPRKAGAPPQDLLKHWVADTGFGMKLAQKILRAHGGSISAAGLAGTGLSFVLRIPSERVALGLIDPRLGVEQPPVGAELVTPMSTSTHQQQGLNPLSAGVLSLRSV